MKRYMHILLFFVIIVFTIACDSRDAEHTKQAEIPKVLNEKTDAIDFVSGRNEDLVENLYNELAEKEPVFNELKTQINDLNHTKGNATAKFNKYSSKNKSYYAAADSHAKNISDTVLRQKITRLISASLARYRTGSASYISLLKNIDQKQITINDLHAALKIIKTLPIIERYQLQKMPDTKSIKGYMLQQDKTISQLDSLIRS